MIGIHRNQIVENDFKEVNNVESLNKNTNSNDIHEYSGFQAKKKKNLLKIFIAVIITILLIIISAIYVAKIPIIKYNGEKIVNIEYGSIYNDEGINVYTRFKNITDQVIIENDVDTFKLGTYIVKYTVPYFNSTKLYFRTVNVVDTESPAIILEGNSNYELTYGEEYNEPGYTANDNYDGDLTSAVVINKIDIDDNNYEIHYIATDSSGNQTDAVRYIKIVDNVAPKLTLNGNSVVSVITGSSYTEQGATATDNKDGDVSANISIESNVDTSKEGTYTITYTVSDFNGNTATEKRKVIVGDKQSTGVIYLTFDDGPSAITPKILDVLKEKGVKATFFVINYSESNAYLVQREVDEGHAIGIHGYSHDYAKVYNSVEDCYNNFISLQERIYNLTGVKTMLIRFPGGSSNTVSKKYCPGIMTQITKKMLDEGFKYYDWNVASGDSGDVNTKEAVYNNVTKGLKAGRNNIVLMHDFSGNNKTLDALPDIIDYGLANGYTFETITMDTEMVTQKIQN